MSMTPQWFEELSDADQARVDAEFDAAYDAMVEDERLYDELNKEE